MKEFLEDVMMPSIMSNAGVNYGAIGSFMSVYYKYKKGRNTVKEVQEAKQDHFEITYAEVDMPVDGSC